MLISSLELKTLFGNRDISTITTEEIIEKRNSQKSKSKNNSTNNFTTWEEVGTIINEWGESKIGVITKTGFENEGQ